MPASAAGGPNSDAVRRAMDAYNAGDIRGFTAIHGKGAESGADVEVEIAFLTTFRDGQAIRVEEFLDPDEAMRALESGNGDS